MSHSLSESICVAIPHAGLLCPPEIDPETLSDSVDQAIADNTDWYTNLIYSFTDILNNVEVGFPYNQVFINVNRHPQRLEDSVPSHLEGLPLYKPGLAPSIEQKKDLVRKYHESFHHRIQSANKSFILDGHSTIDGHTDVIGTVVTEDIIVSDFQKSALDDPEGISTAPKGYLETYIEELDKRLAGTNIRVQANTAYTATYGHSMATHGWNGSGMRGQRAPLLLQETNERLYIENSRPLIHSVEFLRRAFAEALLTTAQKMQRLYDTNI